MTNTMNELTSTAAALAGKDDRYLLVLVVIILLAGGAWVMRYLVKSQERMQARQENQGDRVVEVVIKCSNALDNNTRILERVERKLPAIPCLALGLIMLSGCAKFPGPGLNIGISKEGLTVSLKTAEKAPTEPAAAAQKGATP